MICETCDGSGCVRAYRSTPEPDCDIKECRACHGSGEVPGDIDEPYDIDDDRDFNPYTGAREDDGYDTGSDR